MTRLDDALQRAHALREEKRMGLNAEAPACRLDEAPLPPIAAYDPALVTVDLEPPRQAAPVRMAIFTAAAVILAILVGWYLFELREAPQPSAKPSSGLKLEQRLSTQK